YQVARAYRMALDDFEKIPEAKAILLHDGGRQKTSWRFRDPRQNPLGTNPQTGIRLGTITAVDSRQITISLEKELPLGSSLFVFDTATANPLYFKADKDSIICPKDSLPRMSSGNSINLKAPDFTLKSGSIVHRLPHALSKTFSFIPKAASHIRPNPKKVDNIYNQLTQNIQSEPKPAGIYFRIKDARWLEILNHIADAHIIVPLELASALEAKQQNLIPETPLYTPETSLQQLHKACIELQIAGFKRFMISRMAHLQIFKNRQELTIIANEYVYSMNDAAIYQMSVMGIKDWVTPLENDFPNVLASKHRESIIPLYFRPPLYLSIEKPLGAMDSISIDPAKPAGKLSMDMEGSLHKTFAETPVCLFGFYERLGKLGYKRFLIDLSYDTPDEKWLEMLLTQLKISKSLAGTSTFNFKKGLH
ncbi:MAG: hypothetical protein U1C33_06655, partial [Candidatus Cloacimonadaceae bacterium]|nr:hypothetical protein [Candidatus Cloacimonadaceae bacterium]